MPQYLVAIQHPNNYDPSLEGEAMIRDIGALNKEMDAAGARFFAGGLEPPAKAKSLRKQPGGRWSSPTGRILRPKSTWAASGYSKPLTWMRRSRGDAKPPSPAGFLSRCERS